MSTPSGRTGRLGKVLTNTFVAVIALAGFGYAAGAPAAAAPGSECLWAGQGYAEGQTVDAGGWEFRCHTTVLSANWTRTPTGNPSNVPNPGAVTAPWMQFSVGAIQPGSAYEDYCAGDQLIEGSESIYEVRQVGALLLWEPAGFEDNWVFDQGTSAPGPSWRTSSMCYDGVLS